MRAPAASWGLRDRSGRLATRRHVPMQPDGDGRAARPGPVGHGRSSRSRGSHRGALPPGSSPWAGPAPRRPTARRSRDGDAPTRHGAGWARRHLKALTSPRAWLYPCDMRGSRSAGWAALRAAIVLAALYALALQGILGSVLAADAAGPIHRLCLQSAETGPDGSGQPVSRIRICPAAPRPISRIRRPLPRPPRRRSSGRRDGSSASHGGRRSSPSPGAAPRHPQCPRPPAA